MTSPDPMKEKCKQCQLENNKGICDRRECSNHPSPAGWEEELRRLLNRNIAGDGGAVGTKYHHIILDFIKVLLANRDAALVEKVRGMKAATTNVEGDPYHYKLGYRDALDAVISLITNRERV